MAGSALDALKETFWEARSALDFVTDYLSGHDRVEEGEGPLEILDALSVSVAERLNEQIGGGIVTDPVVRVSDRAWDAARTYDDGTPVIRTIVISDGVTSDYMPRIHGDFDAWRQRVTPKPHLVAVD